MATNEEILTPKVLVVPSQVIINKALTGAPVGSLIMSGAKLYVAVTTGVFELVTSG